MRRWFTDNKLIRIGLDRRYQRTYMYIGVFSNHVFDHSSASVFWIFPSFYWSR